MPSITSLLAPFAIALLGVFGGFVTVGRTAEKRESLKLKFDNFVMGIVRDIGRYKAKKRRHRTTKGLIAFLKDNDDPLEDLIEEQEMEKTLENLQAYTADELLEFGDGRDGRPILIGILGRVYDVSSGSKFYGPDVGSYGHFAGFDVTYALSTGCKSIDCVQDPPENAIEQLTEKQLKEGQRWLSFFHLHDKYPLVGKLEIDPLEEIMKNMLLEQGGEGEAKSNLPPILQ